MQDLRAEKPFLGVPSFSKNVNNYTWDDLAESSFDSGSCDFAQDDIIYLAHDEMTSTMR